VRGSVEAELDRHLTRESASKALAFLHGFLRGGAEPARSQERDADDPEIFHCRHLILDRSRVYALDFHVCDGWEPDKLHVLKVEVTAGRRIGPQQPP
jgi:hypothetical protein